MGLRSFFSLVGSWLTHRHHGSTAFIENPYEAGVYCDENGKFRRKNLRVSFAELLYDLSLVAALTNFSKEAQLSSGSAIGSYVFYVAILWSVFASQTFYACRFGAQDGLSSITGAISMLTFGYLAAVSGNYQVDYGLSHQPSESSVPQLVARITMREPDHPDDIERALKAVSGVVAASKCLLLLQYIVPLYFARQSRKPIRPILLCQLGILINALCWFSALGASFSHGNGGTIARIVLWTFGIIFEWICTYASTTSQGAVHFELEYYAERWAALTLIFLGEGVIGLFESFKVFLSGVAVNEDSFELLIALSCAVLVLRCMYYVYFPWHSHHIKYGSAGHLGWGLLHYPMHICLLLATRTIAKTIQSISLKAALGRIAIEVMAASSAADAMTKQLGNSTTVSILASVYNTTEMSSIAGTLGLNWPSRIATMETFSGNSTAAFVEQYVAEVLSVLGYISNSYGFPLAAQDYDRMDAGLEESIATQVAEGIDPSGNQFSILDVFGDTLRTIYTYVWRSQIYAFTVFGGYILCVCAIFALQANIHTKYRLWSYRYRLLLGVILVVLTCLDIGDMPDVAADFIDLPVSGAPIYFIASAWSFIPIIFAILATIVIVDILLFFLRLHEESKKKASAATTSLDALPAIGQSQAGTNGIEPETKMEEDETNLNL